MPDCPECKGTGRYVGLSVSEDCRACSGSGVAPVRLPASRDKFVFDADSVRRLRAQIEAGYSPRARQIFIDNDPVLTGSQPLGQIRLLGQVVEQTTLANSDDGLTFIWDQYGNAHRVPRL